MDVNVALKSLHPSARIALFILTCACFLLSPSSEGAVPDEKPGAASETPVVVPAGIESAVVKVFATARQPDLYRPWTKPAPTEVSGSGVVIDGKRILTNAHVVAYASEIQIQSSQGGDRISAKVLFAAPGIDLAVLSLDDEAFFKSHSPIVRSNALPSTKDSVLVYGYPTGGQSLSVTKGIVSRTEFVSYNFPVSGLRVQIDAAINPGNSGGPAVAADKMIGLAFSHLGNAENIGYIIPNEEIDLFLQDIADGRYDGKPAIFDEFQTLENPALRAYLKLGDDVRGIVVNKPFRDDPAYPLKAWDVVTRIGDTPVDDQGEVTLGQNLRVKFPYMVQKVAANGFVALSIVRNGKPMNIRLPVVAERPLLIPELKGKYPSYFIFGPLVFSIASQQIVHSLMSRTDWANSLSFIGSPLIAERLAAPSAEHEELVVVSSPLFPHKIGKGYSSHVSAVLQMVNGTRIRSLRHLVTVLRNLKDDTVVFEFAGRGVENLVFPRSDMLAATEAIMSDNDIRSQGSADVMAIWDARPRHE